MYAKAKVRIFIEVINSVTCKITETLQMLVTRTFNEGDTSCKCEVNMIFTFIYATPPVLFCPVVYHAKNRPWKKQFMECFNVNIYLYYEYVA